MRAPTTRKSLSERTLFAGQEALAGRYRGWRAWLPFAGPAIVVSVAYIDPGNFATNIQAGAHYGYDLLWVAVVANLIAMLFQALSAKLGIVTGRNLAELCRSHFPRPVVYVMWIASEIAAMATDLAELLGAAAGLSLLFNLPLLASLFIAAALTYAILAYCGSGFRTIEIMVAFLVGIVGFSYLLEVLIAPLDWPAFLYHTFIPKLDDTNSITLAVGIIGATVMPHAIYLHSSLTQNRIPTSSSAAKKRLLAFSHREVILALSIAGLINVAMIAMAAAAFNNPAHNQTADIQDAYQTLIPLLGKGAAGLFILALLASAISSSVVGTMAGQVVIQGFVGFRIPLAVRRLVTIIPSIIVVALGADLTRALVISQVVLSFVLPVPIIALIIFTARQDVMGKFVNSLTTNLLAIASGIAIIALNVLLIVETVK